MHEDFTVSPQQTVRIEVSTYKGRTKFKICNMFPDSVTGELLHTAKQVGVPLEKMTEFADAIKAFCDIYKEKGEKDHG